MKVLFDHQLFSYQRYGGASKYFAMLMSRLPGEVWETTTIFSNNEYVRALGLFEPRHLLKNHFFRGQGRIMNELNKPYSLWRLMKRDYDVFHQTHFEPYCLKAIGNKPMVTTFHDINFSTLNPNPRIVGFQEKSLTRADKIIAVSENTKRDVCRLFNIEEKKVEVIHHGIIPHSVPKGEKLFDFPYVLYVGTRQKHKNFSKFTDAFGQLHSYFPDLHLVCTRSRFTADEREHFARLGISEYVHCSICDEDGMNILYRDAVLFAFPSLYEGFGMPILEAMVNECPVVLSDASCFPEIAADAALYFDPVSADDMFEKMKRVIEDDDLRKSLMLRGNARVGEFSWEKCAEKHMKVYQELV